MGRAQSIELKAFILAKIPSEAISTILNPRRKKRAMGWGRGSLASGTNYGVVHVLDVCTGLLMR